MLNLPKTPQEIFNRVWERSVVRKLPLSVLEDKICVYRPPNGKFSEGCHVGIFMTEEVYNPEWDTRSAPLVRELADNDRFWRHTDCAEAKEFREFLCAHTSLLMSLQKVHDRISPQDRDVFGLLREGLTELARQRNLLVPEG